MAKSKLKKKVSIKKKTKVARASGKSKTKKTISKTTKKAKPKAKSAPKAGTRVQAKPKAKSQTTTKKVVHISEFVTPLDDRLIVQVVEKEKMTPGGLYIPDTVSVEQSYLKARVVSVGRGHRNDKGKIRPMDVQLGDSILFTSHAGTKIHYKEQEFLIIRESDVLGTVNK